MAVKYAFKVKTLVPSNLFEGQMTDTCFLTLEEALSNEETKDQAIDKIKSMREASKNKRMIKDGFQAGWQENLGMYVGGKKEYDKILKEKGLVEIGYDYVPKESHGNTDFFKTDEFIKTCIDNGIGINDQEEKAIKSGDYFKE